MLAILSVILYALIGLVTYVIWCREGGYDLCPSEALGSVIVGPLMLIMYLILRRETSAL